MLPPHELKNKNFSKVLRGYSAEEVDEHIAFIIQKYTELYIENDELSRKLKTAEAKVEQMKKEEESIRTALINAQRTGSRLLADAKKQAALITKATKENCDRILSDFREQVKAERDLLYRLRKEVAHFKAKIFGQYSEHIAYLESIAPDADDSAEWEIPDRAFVQKAVAGVKSDMAKAMAEQPADQPADQPTEQPVEQLIEQPAEAIAIPTEPTSVQPISAEPTYSEAVPEELPVQRQPVETGESVRAGESMDIKSTILELNKMLSEEDTVIDRDDPLKALTDEFERARKQDNDGSF